MKCHYTILEVDCEANDDEIKKSYRKLALKWHPDKNPANADEAKEQFQLIQQAYEVLSDPQERAWYDKHKDSILKGGYGSDYKDDSLNVYQYFTTSCYKGYGDDDKGFYAVYSEVFKTISAEDSEFDNDLDSDFEIPVFGNSQSSYDDVVRPFYSHWESYTTKKSYSWLDEFDIRQAQNRRVVRCMEKENKKIRDKAKKERNEEVRALVAFVRKRDKRVVAYSEYLEQKAKENDQKAKELRQKQILQRKAEMESYVESDWSKFSNLEKELAEIEANLAEEFQDNDSEDDEYLVEDDPLYCIACDKVFKTVKAFTNHEKSKRHKENVQNLNEMMMQDDREFGTIREEEEGSSEISQNPEEEEEPQESVEEPKKCKKKKKGRRLNDVEDDTTSEKTVQHVTRKDSDSEVSEGDRELEHSERNEGSSAATKKKKGKTKKPPVVPVPDHSENELDLDEIEATRKSKKGRNRSDNVAAPSKTKTKKKEQKQAKNSIPVEGNHEEVEIKPNKPDGAEISCVSCKEVFKSKNALFKHLKSTGHAVPTENPPIAVKKGKSKR